VLLFALGPSASFHSNFLACSFAARQDQVCELLGLQCLEHWKAPAQQTASELHKLEHQGTPHPLQAANIVNTLWAPVLSWDAQAPVGRLKAAKLAIFL
jgi:hypothetical protein